MYLYIDINYNYNTMNIYKMYYLNLFFNLLELLIHFIIVILFKNN